MTTAIWDAARGQLHVDDAARAALQQLVTGSTQGVALESLDASGFLADLAAGSRPATGLVSALANPTLVTLDLAFDGRVATASADLSTAVLELPRSSTGVRELLVAPVSLLPLGLARLVDLRPGPDIERADASPDDVASAPQRRRWRLTSRWQTSSGRSGGARMEILDSTAGWWWVEGDAAVAVSATEVWRAIVAMVMRRDADGSLWARQRENSRRMPPSSPAGNEQAVDSG